MRSLLRFCTLGLVALGPIGLAANTGWAQDDDGPRPGRARPDGPPERADAGPSVAANILGDTSRFTRFSGWGGMGGTAGQWGLCRSVLVMLPGVQQELGLDDDQKKALREWAEVMQDRLRGDGDALREEGEAAMRSMNLGMVMNMMGRVGALVQENEAGVFKILSKSQWKRLDQIALQMEGITAVARPEIAERLQVNEEQAEQIQAILAEARTLQMGYWFKQMLAMRQTARSGANQGEGGDRRPGAANEEVGQPESPERGRAVSKARQTDPEEENRKADEASQAERKKLRAERQKQMQAQFASIRDGADALHAETVSQLLKVLAPRQRTNFDRMLGKTFDPNQLFATAEAKPSEKPADPQANDGETRTKPTGAEKPRPRPAPRLRSNRKPADAAPGHPGDGE